MPCVKKIQEISDFGVANCLGSCLSPGWLPGLDEEETQASFLRLEQFSLFAQEAVAENNVKVRFGRFRLL